MYALVKNDSFVRWVELRTDYPNTSFPEPMTASDLPEGVVQVGVDANRPAPGRYQTVVQASEPVQTDEGWTLGLLLVDMTADEIAQTNEDKAGAVRARRNGLLSASDWTQLADAGVDTAGWSAYRQGLRDLPLQAGFPWDVQWPAKP